MEKSTVFLVLFLLFLTSCIFTPEKENFVNINQDVTAPTIINQNLDLNSDTLFVWNRTVFNFDFVSSNQSIMGVVIRYNNRELRFESGKGSFEINPQEFTDSTYSFELMLYTHSGTGSLADVTGNEGFQFQKKWVLVIETPKPPVLKLTTSITADGFLKISWDKFDKRYFVSYELQLQNSGINHSYSFLTTDKECTSYIDSFFVGGKLNITLATRYSDSDRSINTAFAYSGYHYPLSLKFTEKADSLILSWGKNPFRCKRYLSIAGENAQPIEGDTSCTIRAQGLGDPIQYCISFQPLKMPYYDHQKYYLYASYAQGINLGCEFSTVVYHPQSKAFFVKYPMYIRKFSETDFRQLASYDYYWDYWDDISLMFSPDGKEVCSTNQLNQIVLDATDLKLLKSQPLPLADEFVHYIHAAKWLNDSLFLMGYNSCFVLINSNSNTVVAQSNMLKEPGAKSNQCFGISANGKYMAYCDANGLVIYENVNNRELRLKYEDSKKYYNCVFDLKRPERLILNAPNDNLFWNCETSTAEGSVGSLVANPVNIDPVTNNLLMISNNKAKIYVYDMETQEIRFEIPFHGGVFQFKLLNNCIFFNSGYVYKIPSDIE